MADTIEKTQEQIDNQLWVVMLERMLQEKYGRIQYLAIQPAPDPTITQINNDDLAWLLSEKDRCIVLEKQIEEERERYVELEKQLHSVQADYQGILDSRTWRWGIKLGRIVGIILSPFRKLKHALQHT